MVFLTNNMSKHNGRDISKKVSSKYSQKLLIHAKQSAIEARKTASENEIQKAEEKTGDLMSKKIANKITNKL